MPDLTGDAEMHPHTHSRRSTDRRITTPPRPSLHLLRAVFGLAPAGEPVPGLSRWRRTADLRTRQVEK